MKKMLQKLGILLTVLCALTVCAAAAEISPLYQEITVEPGQLIPETCEVVENEAYGYVADYELEKGHTLSISDTDYVFSVRKLVDGNYSTLLKSATNGSFTATEDMTVGMLIRKPDKSALTAEELAGVMLVDASYDTVWEPLAGKTISILGASISTYDGISNNADTNSTIGSNAVYYTEGHYDVYADDTWWMQLVDDMGLELLVNNSWSGSSLLYERSGTVGAYVDRCVQLHNNEGETPDIIAIQMGTNDFQYYKDTLGTADIDYDALITANGDGTYTYATPVTSLEAAAIVLHKISIRYPNAEVYYLNISQRVDDTDDLIQSFNAELKQVVEHFDAHIVDIYGSAITMEDFDTYIGDGRVHPNKLGMDAYTEAFKRALIENTAYSVETHTVSFALDGVAADYGDDKIVVDGDAFTVDLTASGGDELAVTVTMGGKDITASAYADGTVTIDAVTADATITAEATDHVARNYRWEFDGTDLVCVSGDNALTKNAGTTTDGVFSKTRYALKNSVVLLHDQPWEVEWKSEGTFLNTNGSSGARVFTSTDVNADYNARYIFKSATDWLIAMGEKNTSGSHNYGIALADYGIDGSELHTYRLENRIAAGGSNMVYLYVDGTEIGPMNNYYVGTTSQNTTSDWLSGKDFVFPYMGTDTHGLTNCSIDYIQVWEGGHVHRYENGRCTLCGEVASDAMESMAMRYDDHVDVSGKTVEIVDAGTPTSYQVGYGVVENTVLDTAVVTLDGNTLIATGIGTATVRIDGQLYEVTVTAAPISLLLLAGQSNMRGSEGNADQSIVCPDGMVYSTYGDDRGADNTAMTVDNAAQFAPSALTGAYSTINVEGTIDCLSGYPIDSLTEAGMGKMGPDSGFAYEWVQQTGEKVWIVNAAHGGSSITTWQDGGANYEEAVLLFSACQETLRQEIAAGHYTLSHMGYFWCQGCTDYSRTAEWYVNKYLTMHENFKTELAFDADSNEETADVVFEFGGIIPVRAGNESYTSYRQGTYADTTTASYYESFKDLRFTGPRVAQYWMGNNPELEDIWLVCNIGEDWVWMPDGTNGVTEYFQSHYPNGTVDYTTQVAQKGSWYTPTTPAAVHDSIHYNQIGYNEVGRESVRNALILLGEIEAPEAETTVEFLTWDGVTSAQEAAAWMEGTSDSLVVPVVSPIWKAKEVTYGVTDGLIYSYYDLLADTARTEGTLTASTGERVSVVKQEPSAYFANHLSQLPEPLCCGVNLWTALEHDDQYFLNGSSWGKHSSGAVYSVTIPVEPGDRIFATAFGKAGENGNASSNGIRCTFFGEYEVVKTLAPADTYAEFTANGGYLIVPEGAVAVNVPMWTNDENNELYVLNLPHDQTEGICSICGEDSHSHAWSDWETVSLPTADALGVEERKCECGETETREIEGVWQKYALADHMQAMPEVYCAGTNLWTALEHDDQYFLSGSSWGKHSSGTVYSVTIPVEPGDRIFATSFGKAGENGTTQNGIRVTFFDACGVLKTMTPSETYPAFTANGGYLIVPEGAVAMNVPMWNNSDENELYILNADHDYSGASCTICGAEHPEKADYSGKVISILGDSISTFSGVSNNTDYNSTIGSNAIYYSAGTLGVYRADTWWQQTIDALGMELLVNNSWSGSCILHTRSSTVGAYVDRCVQLHNDHTGDEPDVIAVFMGTNDFSYYQSALGTADIDYDTLITENSDGSYSYATPTTTCEAYAIMLHKMIQRYPDAEIYCMTMTARRDPDKEDSYADVGQPTAFNAELAKIIEHFGCTVVDLENCGIDKEAEIFDVYMGDGRVHPNAHGMDKISEALISAMLGEDATICAVDYTLTGVKSDNSTATVLAGSSFTARLDADGNVMNVAVTMNGQDITDSCYADGVITIASVTGDITITATAVKAPAEYRWELEGTNLISAGKDENKPTLQGGSVSNGVLTNAYYSLTEQVVLRHDLPWILEFKASGSWSGMVFSAQKTSSTAGNTYLFKTTGTNGFIGFGERVESQYRNYGIALGAEGVDTTLEHTYRLENRIASDGTNMVHLMVDGVDYGTMNHYFVGGSNDQDTTADWLNGRDLTFSYIGADGHAMNNCALDYIQVWEGGKPNQSQLTDYSGKVISILGASICTFDGYIPVADGFNLEHVARYPQDNLLTDVNDTWWMQVINSLDAKLGINDSWRSTEVYNACTDEVNSSYDGTKACLSSVTRIQNLGSNGTPDVILFFGGTNDITQRRPLGTFDPAAAPTEVDLTSETWTTVADAYTALIMRLQYYYPDSQIVAMLPYRTASNSDAVTAEYTSVFAAICAHYGVTCIDMKDCGITTADLPDGTHPNAKGMDYISNAVLETLLSDCDMEPGENVVHPVTHELSGAESSLSFYKGVSYGKSFITTITGENITVTVTMGGVDITDQVYADGKITISAVTDDVVITAKGVYNADGRLQQLPDDYCCNTNLWTLLDPVNEYYTASGWGNNSNSNYSVTFPVTAGDRIWATSFGAAGTNGYSDNAVRITWFGENGVLKSLGRDVVYAEFAAYGYITAPEGAVALNVPMASNADTWELYILSAEHDYESAVTSPTCTEQGYTTYTCKCGDSYKADYVPAKGHTEVTDKAVAATCTTAGKTEGKHCSVCDTVLVKQETVPAKGHSWDGGVVTTQPTEDAAGVKTYTCTACGTTKTETVPVLGHTHSYTRQVTAPTCTGQGYTTYTCKCGDSYKANYVPAKGHTEVTDKAVAATCTTAGKTEGKHCSVCDTVLVKQETVPAKGHSWDGGVVTTQPTEDAAGVKTYTCTACGTTKAETVPVLGHTHSYTRQVTAPTCTAQGYTTYTCKCGDSYKANYVPAKGHTEVTDKAVAATCTATGLTEGKHCSVCSAVLVKQETVPVKGHSWDGGVVTTQPTEDATGVKTYTCTACGTTKTETVPALGKPQEPDGGSGGGGSGGGSGGSGGGSGGGGFGGGEYMVKVQTATKGFIQVSEVAADEGDEIIVTVTANPGYKLAQVLITDEDGKIVPVKPGKDGAFSFEMPDSDVTVEAEFTARELPFTDVAATAWYAESVAYAYDEELVAGTSASTFSPDAACTRAQTVTFLWRAMGCPEAKTTACPFVDVAADAYYYEAVLWAVENGITLGTSETTFGPEQTVDRAQAVTFLWRAQGAEQKAAASAFADVKADAYYYPAICWAVSEGVTNGTSAATFSPTAPCTRAHAVTFIYNALVK